MAAVFNHIAPAYAASVSDDSPPMPMGVSDSGNSEKIFKKRSFLILMEGWEGTQALVQGDSHRSGKIQAPDLVADGDMVGGFFAKPVFDSIRNSFGFRSEN